MDNYLNSKINKYTNEKNLKDNSKHIIRVHINNST